MLHQVFYCERVMQTFGWQALFFFFFFNTPRGGRGSARVCLHPLAVVEVNAHKKQTHGRHMSGRGYERSRRRPIGAQQTKHWLRFSTNGARPPPEALRQWADPMTWARGSRHMLTLVK